MLNWCAARLLDYFLCGLPPQAMAGACAAGEPVELASAAAAAPAPAQTPAPAPAPLAPPPAPGPRARRRDDDEVPPPEPFGAAPALRAHAILHHIVHQRSSLWSSDPSSYSRRSALARAAAQLCRCTLCERPDSRLVAAAQSTPRPRAGRVPRFPCDAERGKRHFSWSAPPRLGDNMSGLLALQLSLGVLEGLWV